MPSGSNSSFNSHETFRSSYGGDSVTATAGIGQIEKTHDFPDRKEERLNTPCRAKEESRPTLLIVGVPASPLLGSTADKLGQFYRVRVAEMRDTAVAYLACMKFDLVIIDPTISKETISAITCAAPPETAIYAPGKSATATIMNEISSRLDCKRTGRER